MVYFSGPVKYGDIHRSSASARPPCDGTPSAFGGIFRMVSHHMPVEAQWVLSNYAGDLTQPGFPGLGQVTLVALPTDSGSYKLHIERIMASMKNHFPYPI